MVVSRAPLGLLFCRSIADPRIPVRVQYDEPSEDSAGFEAYQVSGGGVGRLTGHGGGGGGAGMGPAFVVYQQLTPLFCCSALLRYFYPVI